MDLSAVKNNELLERLVSLKGEETKTALLILYHLLELDRRKLFLELGYSSLFQYCVRKLNYSEGGAYRRIAGARILGDYPEIAEMFLAGNVSLCSMATAAEGLRRGRLTCAELSGKSKREVETMVASTAPVKREVKNRFWLNMLIPRSLELHLSRQMLRMKDTRLDSLSLKRCMTSLQRQRLNYPTL